MTKARGAHDAVDETPEPGNQPRDPNQSLIPGPSVRASAMETGDIPLPNWSVLERGGRTPGSPLPAGAPAAQYILQDCIGRGSAGEVWRAVQATLGRHVAVKRTFPRPGESELDRTLREHEFRQEARVAGLLEHPNIVPVHDLGAAPDGAPLLSMKLVDGKPWEELLAADLPVLESGEFLARHIPTLAAVAQAVAFAHSRGVVHRDLKPSQVIVGQFGEVLLTDWGLALCFNPSLLPTCGDEEAETLGPAVLPTPATAPSPAGTPSMMAPEQTRSDARLVGPWTDVYLLGATLYLLLTGTPPHASGSVAESLELARRGCITPPSERSPGRSAPEPLVRLCLAALAPDPGDRPTDAAAFLAALREYQAGAEKRSRSRELAGQARDLANAAGEDYLALARALSLLEDALRLWPENASAIAVREDCLASQVRISIAGGDLLLARLTLERLDVASHRDSLAALLARAESHRSQSRRERLLLRRGSLLLLLLIASGATWFTWQLSQEHNDALTARDHAQAARTRAEGLLEFLIGDLRTRLEPTGRLDVMDGVTARAHQYLALAPTGLGHPPPARLIRQVDLLEREATRASARHPPAGTQTRWLAAAANAQRRLGVAYSGAGWYREAEWASTRGLENFGKLAAVEPGSQEWLIGQVDCLRLLGESRCLSGDPEGGGDAIASATTLLQAHLAGHAPAGPGAAALPDGNMATMTGEQRFLWSKLAELDGARGETFRRMNLYSQAAGPCRRAMGMARQLVAAEPGNTAYESLLGRQLRNLGALLLDTTEPAEAAAALAEAVGVGRKASSEAPEDPASIAELGRTLLLLSRAQLEAGDPAGALASRLSAVDALAIPVSQDEMLRDHARILEEVIEDASEIEERLHASGVSDVPSALSHLFAQVLEGAPNPGAANSWVAGFSTRYLGVVQVQLEGGDAWTLGRQEDALARLMAAVGARDPRIPWSWTENHCLLACARAARLTGQLENAGALARSAVGQFRDMSDSWVGGKYTRFLMIDLALREEAIAAHRRGDEELARQAIDQALAQITECRALAGAPEPLPLAGDAHLAMALLLRGQFCAQGPQSQAAKADYAAALEVMEPHSRREQLYLLQPLAMALALNGREAEGSALLDRISAGFVPAPEVVETVRQARFAAGRERTHAP